MRHQPRQNGNGILQAAVPKDTRPSEARRANGLNLRGVVVGLYTRDNPPPGTRASASMYAAVACYGRRRIFLPRVLVSQAFGSVHTGVIGGLRVATQALGGGPIDLDRTDAANFDGSHVVVSFLDDDLAQPYVSGTLEHPLADGGGPVTGPIEDRVRLAQADGRPLLVRWNGAVWGLNGDGDFLLDLEAAHDGTLGPDGVEPPPATDGTRGNFRVRMPEGSTLTVEVGGQAALTLEHSAADGTLTVGDGAVSAAIAEHLRDLYNDLIEWIYNELIVETPLGPSAPPVAAGAPPAPAWNDAIVSGKLRFPDGG